MSIECGMDVKFEREEIIGKVENGIRKEKRREFEGKEIENDEGEV
jgi:hypothetical protein